MNKPESNLKDELNALERSISRANIVVIVWIVGWAAFYFIWFFCIKHNGISDVPANWGVMGDFFGGVLNPVVAYFAFYWLTKSVRLQKEELAEARDALGAAAAAQDQQAQLARTSVRLEALSTLANTIIAEVGTQRTLLQFYVNQLSPPNRPLYDIEGRPMHFDDFKAKIADLNATISKRMLERWEYEEEIKKLTKFQGENLANDQ